VPHSFAVFDRWEQDYGSKFVRDTLSLLYVARQGLSEFELLEMLQVPHADWTRLYVALKEALFFRSGLFAFGNKAIQEAVRGKYMASSTVINAVRLPVAPNCRPFLTCT